MASLSLLIVILPLVGLIALGVYVNVNRVLRIVGANGYRIVNFDTTSWDIVYTVGGTAVGLIAATALAIQDDDITRHELASDRGVVAMIL